MSNEPLTLTTENAHEFWDTAWSKNATGWRGGEAVHPFVRNLYVFVASQRPELQATVSPLPYDARALGEAGGSLFSGTEEANVVRGYVAGKCVLVPLCGDSPALAFFAAQGAAMVVGADLSAQALAAQRLNNFPGVTFSATVVQEGEKKKETETEEASTAERVVMYEATVQGTVVRLFEGDVLRLPELSSAFTSAKADFVYDRAAFMAINPTLRDAYVRTISGQLAAGAPLLVERPVRKEGDLSGPPFTFGNEVLKELYEKHTGHGFDVTTILQFKWGEARPTSPLWMEFIAMKPLE